METKELKKQFRIMLFEKHIIISKEEISVYAFNALIKPEYEIKIGEDDWLDTKENYFNYYECCGVLLLFNVKPPTYDELYKCCYPYE